MNKLTLSSNKESETLTFNVSGRIDTSNAQDFESGIKAELDGITKLILDFADVEYISSAGLRALLSINKVMNSKSGEFIIRKPSEMVYEVFEVTGFADVLTIEQ